jgi:hypothetical protein
LHPKFYKRIFLWNIKSTPNYSKMLISEGIPTHAMTKALSNVRFTCVIRVAWWMMEVSLLPSTFEKSFSDKTLAKSYQEP